MYHALGSGRKILLPLFHSSASDEGRLSIDMAPECARLHCFNGEADALW